MTCKELREKIKFEIAQTKEILSCPMGELALRYWNGYLTALNVLEPHLDKVKSQRSQQRESI